MAKLVWLTDLHFSADDRVFGIDTRARVLSAVSYINERMSDADACVISGDLVNRGTDKDYQALASLLADLNVPLFPMVGNHDVPDLLRKHLTLPADCLDDFVQYEVALDGCSILCLDTQRQGSDQGAFCQRRAEWLEARLSAEPPRPTIVFTHHPPLELGLPMQDQDRLRDGGRLVAQLTRFAQVRYLCCGHVHRPVSGVVQGLAFSTLRSALFQAPAPIPPWTWADFSPAQEAPQLAVLDVAEANVTIQFHDFCTPGNGAR